MPRRRRRKQRQPRISVAHSSASNANVSDRRQSTDFYSESSWRSRRQGARNAAGVRYQLVVTAHLLAEARRGELPFVELVPEGYEDIDCLDQDSNRWFIQAKDVGAGADRFTAGSVAAAINHAAPLVGPSSRIAVVTDGQLGSQLVESGWSKAISETPCRGVDSIMEALLKNGCVEEEAKDLVARTYLVRVPWNTAPSVTHSIAESYELTPAVAALVSSRLVDDLSQVAADQRGTTADNPRRRTIRDLDVIVDRVLNVVDVEGLDSAVRTGVCEVADYGAQPGAKLAAFLLGVDAIPAHIGAGFDVIRPDPCRAVFDGLERARYALISGPSGAGKSTQMWRSAQDAAPGAQVIRVRRLETDSDVDELVRYVQLLEPSERSPIVVCCDDLGQPRTARWTLAARRLLELSGVLLIGAVRQEDFTRDLLLFGGVSVELTLEEETGRTVADELERTGVPLRMEVPEALSKADGQFMEYVSLLTTGLRLRATLAGQAESLLLAADQTGAQIARIVCTAHVLGVSIDASDLERVAGGETAARTRALRRLQDEHIITSEDQRSWRGLHQRRSEVMMELLHETPPPTVEDTLGKVVTALDATTLSWALRRVIELFGDGPESHIDAIRTAVHDCKSVRAIAILMEGLERVDNAATAREYIPIMERYRHPRLRLSEVAPLVCADKLSDIEFGESGNSELDLMWRAIRAISNHLSPRSTVYCDVAASALERHLFVDQVVTASLSDAVRVLEAVAPYVSFSYHQLQRIAAAFPWPDGVPEHEDRVLHGRLLRASRAGAVDGSAFVEAFGDVSARVCRAVQAHPNTISSVADPDESIVTIEVLAVPNDDEHCTIDWDVPSNRDGHEDPIHSQAVELATYVGDCCPEVQTVEVKTLLADGSRLVISEMEPGYKRLGTAARPVRANVRVVAGVIAAITRQVAAFSWTEIVRARTGLAQRVIELASEAPRRLNPNDNEGRRRQWAAGLDGAEEIIHGIGPPPAVSELDPSIAPAQWDPRHGRDELTQSLEEVVTALRRLLPEGDRQFVGIAACIQRAARRIAVVLSESRTLMTGEEGRLYPGLTKELDRVRGLLISVSLDPSARRRISGAPAELPKSVDQLVEEAASHQLNAERQHLEAVFSDSASTMHTVLEDDPFPTSIVGHQWIVEVALEKWDLALEESMSINTEVVEVRVVLLCVMEDAVLPLAVELSRMKQGRYIPLTGEGIMQIAELIGRRFQPGGAARTVSYVSDELVLASWEEARRRLRPATWAEVKGASPRSHLEAAMTVAEEAEWGDEALIAAIRELGTLVKAELDGGSAAPIAAELAVPSALRAKETEPFVSEQLVAIALLLAVCMDMQLSDG